MAFDLPRIAAEIASVPVHSPIPPELAVAILCDLVRDADAAPPPEDAILGLGATRPLFREQLGMIAHLVGTPALREASVDAVRKSGATPLSALSALFDAIEPLTGEMIRANTFRQEEAIRQWIRAFGGEVAGETAAQSAARLEQLDYRKTDAEYQRAEKARASEAERRRKLLEEAAQKEADARGWRE